jgi:hypothetical protein
MPGPGGCAESVRSEKTGNKLKLAKIGLELLNERVDADPDERVGVLPEQGAIVTANIEDDVSFGQFKAIHHLVRDAGKMISHRLIDPGPVTIVCREHGVGIDGVAQLD